MVRSCSSGETTDVTAPCFRSNPSHQVNHFLPRPLHSATLLPSIDVSTGPKSGWVPAISQRAHSNMHATCDCFSEQMSVKKEFSGITGPSLATTFGNTSMGSDSMMTWHCRARSSGRSSVCMSEMSTGKPASWKNLANHLPMRPRPPMIPTVGRLTSVSRSVCI